MRKKKSDIIEEERDVDAELRKAIGSRIKEIRQQLHHTAQRVAEKLHMSREALTQIENGRNNVNALILWKLACLFKCDVSDFFPPIPDGYALSKVDYKDLKREAGTKAVKWAERLFAGKQK